MEQQEDIIVKTIESSDDEPKLNAAPNINPNTETSSIEKGGLLDKNEPKLNNELEKNGTSEENQENINIKSAEEEVSQVIKKGEIISLVEKIKKQDSFEIKEKIIAEYKERYLPKYLKEKRRGIIDIASSIIEGSVKFDIINQENIPEKGPFLVVANHFGDGEDIALLKTLKKQNLHITLGKNRWWDLSPVHQWVFKKLGFIPVNESLANLSEQEKEEALKRQPDKYTQKVFRKIIDKEKQGNFSVDDGLARQTVAALVNGDAVSIFPEGLWLNPEGSHNKAELGRAYRGVEIIAKQYKRLTGEELTILPAAFICDRETGKKELKFGEQLTLNKNYTPLNGTDWCMSKLADMLPEEQRGYYKGINQNIAA
jgi:1-acyl-sn-glycerol-3-phosphate acyltransferase